MPWPGLSIVATISRLYNYATCYSITKLYLGDSINAYENGLALPIPVNKADFENKDITKTLTLPIRVTVDGLTSVVSWTVKIKDQTSRVVFTQSASPAQISRSQDGQYRLTIATIVKKEMVLNPLSSFIVEVTIIPGWSSPTGTTTVFYPEQPASKLLKIKLVDISVAMKTNLANNSDYFTLAPKPNNIPISQTIMVSNTTTFQGVINNDQNLVKRVVFAVRYGANSTYVPLVNGSERVSSTVQNSVWQLDWDHRNFLPQPVNNLDGSSLQNISLAWQLCNTENDDSGCVPLNTAGTILTNLGSVSLTLGAVRFDSDLITDPENSPYSLYNSFTTKLKFSFTTIKAPIIKVWVYPKQNSLPPSADVYNQAVTMATRTHPGQTVTPGPVDLDAFWSDNSWKKKDCGRIATLIEPKNCTLAKLREAIKGNASAADVTLGIQYCLVGESNTKLSCSDWAGLDGVGFADWKSQKSFKMDYVAIWEPYGTTEVYDDYLLTTCSASCSPTTRNLTLRVIPMRDSLTSISTTKVDAYYMYDPKNSYPLINSVPMQPILTMTLLANTLDWKVTWNPLPAFNAENLPTYTHSVLLRAQITPNTNESSKYQFVSIYTGGLAPTQQKLKYINSV